MRMFATLVAGGALALGFAGTAGACLCRSLPPVQSYAAATHVVIAKIDSAWVHRTTVVVRLPSRNALSAALGDEFTLPHRGIRATLDITESLKGAPEDLAFVIPDFSCSVRLDLEVEYLLYIDARGVVSRCTAQRFNWMDPQHVALVRMLRLFEGRQPPGIVPDRGIEPRPIVDPDSGSPVRAAARPRCAICGDIEFRSRPDAVYGSRISAFAR